jgi:hypothetical protein
VHYGTLHEEKSNKMQQSINILLFPIYMKLNIFQVTLPIIKSLKLHWQLRVFHTWQAVGRVVGGQCPPATRPTTCHI